MQWDLGLLGVGVLAGLSVGFGVLSQLAFLGRSLWVGAAGAAAFFGAGVFISEILFGWATETELQPNIDGLSFDEVLLGYAIGIPILLGLRHLIRTRITRQS